MNNSYWDSLKKNYHYGLILLVIVVGIGVWLGLSNIIFLKFIKLSPYFNPIHFLQFGWIVKENKALFHRWLLAGFLPFIPILAVILLNLKDHQKTLFGDARWATFSEAKKTGLLENNGIIIGKKWGKYLRISGFEHVFVFAPSGSGKSTALVIPNLLNWNGSCVTQDVKMTLFHLTSKFRAEHGHRCYLWNPGTRDGKTHAYNPLDWISQDKVLRIDDLQKIAHILIPDSPKIDPIWVVQPRMLFVALALYVLDTPNTIISIGSIIRLIKDSPNFSDWVFDIIQDRDDLDPLCYRNFNSFLQTEYKLQTNILQSFMSYFELFDNPLVDAATSKSDFDITQLRKERMTIYVGITPDNLVRFSSLLSLFYQQILDHLLREIPDPNKDPHGVLMLLDEFSALRKMEVLQKSIGLMREYRVRMMILIQDIPQLYDVYGMEGSKSFINNKVRIAFAQNDLDSARLISGWLGEKTVEHRTKNQGNHMGFKQQSISCVKRELMKPEEIMKLPDKKCIIIVEGGNPILANKNFWYKDSQLKSRPKGAIHLPHLSIKLEPFKHGCLVKK